jgi:hypothetical protein
MKILFDFGHPANVHYFKNLITYLKSKNHEVEVLARDKEVTNDLLRSYGIRFINKGTGGTGFFDRLRYTLKSLWLINRQIKEKRPDLCISHASPYLALASWMFNIPHLVFNDTEKAFLFNKVVQWFKPEVYVPECFLINNDLAVNRLQSYMELAYLHPNHFEPDQSVTEKTGRDFILLRFVSSRSTHDLGRKSLNWDFKRELVKAIGDNYRVWISSEEAIPEDLASYKLPVAADQIHDVIAASKLLIGDSATMSSEAAMLGVPTIHIHENRWGYIKELEEKYGLLYHFDSDEIGRQKAIQKISDLLMNEDVNEENRERRNQMLTDKNNMTRLMIEILEEKLKALSD